MIENYAEILINGFTGYARYFWHEIMNPSWNNYFYWLLGLSAVVYGLELLFPWRKNQSKIRKDFWLDLFYVLFNFFLFSLIGYNALSMVAVQFTTDVLNSFGITHMTAITVQSWPVWLQLVTMFIIADFLQWNIHRLLHRVPFLWEFHKVHHSVKEMGFAAQFRFHFLETIVYKSLQYIPLGMIGFGIQEFFIVHMLAVFIGHLNHANINWDYGVFRYLINNPKMHLWHHAKELPDSHRYGVNFGISLSIWDYLFKTAHVPYHKANLELGFEKDENYPTGFIDQVIEPFKKES
jgi:sterol desaturase/sphingolipid hydroxylase (fatty acid hydroxylase superfamily)